MRAVEHAAELPDAWDALAATTFQRRELLIHAEAANPCRQRYYLFEPAGRLTAGAVVYSLSLDLFTYRGLHSPFPMRILGLPFSVGWPGLLGDPADHRYLVASVREKEKGFLLGLNTHQPIGVRGVPEGDTLPTAVLDHEFDGLTGYRSALRSDYRRRFDRVRAAFRGVRERRLDPSDFTGDMYQLYHQAFLRSEAKLECLPQVFFEGLPPPFRLTVFEAAGRLLAWHMSAFEPGPAESPRATFFMGGVDQARNEAFHAYHNVLLSVLEQSCGSGRTQVDFGQTAETAKTRVGARLQRRGLFAWPRSRLFRGVLGLGSEWLEYRSSTPEVHVFRTPP